MAAINHNECTQPLSMSSALCSWKGCIQPFLMSKIPIMMYNLPGKGMSSRRRGCPCRRPATRRSPGRAASAPRARPTPCCSLVRCCRGRRRPPLLFPEYRWISRIFLPFSLFLILEKTGNTRSHKQQHGSAVSATSLLTWLGLADLAIEGGIIRKFGWHILHLR